MSDKTINIVHEGQRKKLDLTGRTFSSIEDAVKGEFQLEEVVLVAKQKDGTECDLWDDADLEKLPTTSEIMVYKHLENPLAFKLGTEEHALDTIPPSNSTLIKVAKEVVLENFDVPAFVGRLEEFVICVRRAHCHLTAGGNYDSANKLVTLGRETLKPLSAKCKMTLDMYTNTTREILGIVQAMFAYCRDGLDESAVINLDHLGKLAADMKDESVARANELEKAMEKVNVVLAEAEAEYVKTGKMEFEKSVKLEDEKKDMKNLTRLRTKSECVIKEATSAKQAYEEIDKTIGFWTRFGWSIKYAFKGKSAHKKYYDWIEKWEKKIAAEKAAAGEDVKASSAKEEEEDKQRAVAVLEKEHDEMSTLLQCLHKAVEAMRIAHATMQQMATFWGTMELATSDISRDQPFVENVRRATKKERREAMKLWRSREFKMEGIAYIARCVAIRDISTACSTGMSTVGKDMERFLTDMPTRTEAAKWLADQPAIEKKSRDFDKRHLFDKAGCVNPSDEEEARKCFKLASLNTKCSDAVQQSD